ncbi:MAG: hypothetical protein NC548_21210 [Lachnospiraceae bacterium]|nr:hypothetical protein [Lachnospiraceae bacterium]
MEVLNLRFFDKKGYDLNFIYNKFMDYWEGNIFLPKVSVGLYANTTFYIMESITVDVNKNDYNKRYIEDDYQQIFAYPIQSKGEPDTMYFQWDVLNSFVDEIFMFTFDDNYVVKKETSLTYVPNNGPDCEPILMNRFSKYEIPLDKVGTDPTKSYSRRAIPVHIAFTAPESHDANTYKRTLILYYNNKQIARINIFAESVEEDERLKVWNYNLGYKITPEDTGIFKQSDIKEPRPDYVLLNEKRKELLLEGHNIYPYIGAYKAIRNIIKFFGYDNLNLIEFWKNINPNNENYGKVFMDRSLQKYTLQETDCIYTKNTAINLPNENYRKLNILALSYMINTPTENVDLYELPYTKENFEYTLEEALLKLFALRKKLNKEFLPATSRIIDIIGEAFYFGIQLIKNGFVFRKYKRGRDDIKLNIDCFPNNTVYITPDKYFNDFIFEYMGEDKINNMEGGSILNTLKETPLSDIINTSMNGGNISDVNKFNLSESKKCEIYKKYYDLVHRVYIKSEDAIDNDIYHPIEPYNLMSSVEDSDDIDNIINKLLSDSDSNNDFINIVGDSDSNSDISFGSDEHGITNLNNSISAKVILSNATFLEKTFEDLDYPFRYIGVTFENSKTINNFQFKWENDDQYVLNKKGAEIPHETWLKWTVTLSDNQIATPFDNHERKNYYYMVKDRYMEYQNPILNDVLNNLPIIDFSEDEVLETAKKPFRAVKWGKIEDMDNVLFELPYVGYYDVTVSIYKNGTDYDGNPTIIECTNTFEKYIKVQPLNIDIRGFYYDSRDINITDYTKFGYVNPDDIESESTDNKTKQENMEEHILKTLDFLTYVAKNDPQRLSYKKTVEGGYDLQMVMNKYLNTYKNGLYKINTGPYGKKNFKIDDYIIQDGVLVIDNVNPDIVNLIPTLKTARYIRHGVDVKPYTWIYLTFDYSQIAHRCEPCWELVNNSTNKTIEYKGQYFTCLLRDEGLYTINLKLKDEFGNPYYVSRNIVTVDSDANHNLYTPYKIDYDNYITNEEYKTMIRDTVMMDLGNYYDEVDGYYFNTTEVESYMHSPEHSIVHVKDNDIEFYSNNKYDEYGTYTKQIINENSRWTLKPGDAIGWTYEVPMDFSSHSCLVLNIEKPDGITPIRPDDELYIFIIQDPTRFYYEKITDLVTNISFETIAKKIDIQNISYILLYNGTLDSYNNVDFKIEDIYCNYPYNNSYDNIY